MLSNERKKSGHRQKPAPTNPPPPHTAGPADTPQDRYFFKYYDHFLLINQYFIHRVLYIP